MNKTEDINEIADFIDDIPRAAYFTKPRPCVLCKEDVKAPEYHYTTMVGGVCCESCYKFNFG